MTNEHRYYVALAADRGEGKFERACAYWRDLLSLSADAEHPLDDDMCALMGVHFRSLASDYANGEASIDQLSGFAQAFTVACGFDLELSGFAQDAFDWIEGVF